MRLTVRASIFGAPIATAGVFRIDQTRPPKTRIAMMTPLQLKPVIFFGIAACEQNCKYDQHRDGADVDENLDQTDELSA